MSTKWIIVMTLFFGLIAGCTSVPDSPPSPYSNGDKSTSDEPVVNFSADWKGDLFLRFGLDLEEGTTCSYRYWASGKAEAPGDFFHFMIHDDQEELVYWSNHGGIAGFNQIPVNPGANVIVNGETVTSDPRRSDYHWGISRRPTWEGVPDHVVVTVAVRGLELWPEEPSPSDEKESWFEEDRSRSILLLWDCEEEAEVTSIEYGEELSFFESDDFMGVAGLHGYVEEHPPWLSATLGGEISRNMNSSIVELFATVSGQISAGTFSYQHPEGDTEWDFNTLGQLPQAHDTLGIPYPFLHVSSRQGMHTMSLDTIALRSEGFTGFLAGVEPIDEFPRQDPIPD